MVWEPECQLQTGHQTPPDQERAAHLQHSTPFTPNTSAKLTYHPSKALGASSRPTQLHGARFRTVCRTLRGASSSGSRQMP